MSFFQKNWLIFLNKFYSIKPKMSEILPKLSENFQDLLWDGPENSDEEIEEMVQYKNQYEKEMGVKFSKNGIIKFIEDNLRKEDTSQGTITNFWQNHFESPGISLYLKKGGSNLSKE